MKSSLLAAKVHRPAICIVPQLPLYHNVQSVVQLVGLVGLVRTQQSGVMFLTLQTVVSVGQTFTLQVTPSSASQRPDCDALASHISGAIAMVRL